VKADKGTHPDIRGALSELTKHMVHIPVKDMEAWVNRPIEVRRREVAQKNGKIARPMNSFMLYRSAYAERTKEWCAQNNHQVVSRVSGKSWPQEPPAIREKFEFFANVERDNHQKAHPEYKFAPNKTQTAPRKKRPAGDDDNSDADEAGFRFLKSSPQIKRARSSEADSCYESRESTPFDSQGSILSEGFNQAAWQSYNPNGAQPMGMLLSQHDQAYYFSAHGEHADMVGSYAEDAQLSKGGFAGGQYNASATLAGLPGSIHHELLRCYPGDTTGGRVDESQLDPQLLVDHPTADIRGFDQYTLWQSGHDLSNFVPVPNPLTSNAIGFNGLPGYHEVQTMEDGHAIWSMGGNEAIGEAGKEFDQWLDAQPPASF
jgi:hypothetical protein